MPVVSSFGQLTHYTAGAAPFNATTPITRSSPPWAIAYANAVYSQIYIAQPEVRTCVDFLGRNMGQLGVQVFRRVSDTDRERLTDHELAGFIESPNPSTTRYRLIEAIVCDLAIYFNAYWLKVRDDHGRMKGVVRMPPETVTVDGWLMPQQFIWTAPGGQQLPLRVEDVVYFGGYNPNGLLGIAPIETLRCRLAESAAAADYRATYWANAARTEGVIERPLAAPKWNTEQKTAFRDQWQARYAGAGNAGSTPLLDEGMTFKQTAYSARDSEYVDARKLTREEVAAAYHIPAPMVGILDHATYSNIREQHKQLYQDTLGPWCVSLQEEFERQILPECRDTDRVYCEFNIHEKLKGSFEEQAAAIQAMVGRPIMTPNEGRARLNLPSITNDPTADQLAMPLNVGTGADAQTGPATAYGGTAATGMKATTDRNTAIQATVRDTWHRQQSRLARIPVADRAEAFAVLRARWDRELARDLTAIYRADGWTVADADEAATVLASRVNEDTYQRLRRGLDVVAPDREGVPDHG